MSALDNSYKTKYQFVKRKYETYKDLLDSDFLKKLETNFYSRYWELLSCCLLKEQCKIKIGKPIFKKNTSNYDLDVKTVKGEFSLENVCIKNSENPNDKVPDDNLTEAFNSHPDKIQLRIANVMSNKKIQYDALLRDGNVVKDRPYVLAIGIYGLPSAPTQVSNFFELSTSYLGAFFPAGNPIIYINPKRLQTRINNTNLTGYNLPNSSYNEHNIKANNSLVNKDTLLHLLALYYYLEYAIKT